MKLLKYIKDDFIQYATNKGVKLYHKGNEIYKSKLIGYTDAVQQQYWPKKYLRSKIKKTLYDQTNIQIEINMNRKKEQLRIYIAIAQIAANGSIKITEIPPVLKSKKNKTKSKNNKTKSKDNKT